jgi:hypothetical protein
MRRRRARERPRRSRLASGAEADRVGFGGHDDVEGPRALDRARVDGVGVSSSSDAVGAALSRFGAAVTPKLADLTAAGEPEDQLRGPFETLFGDLADAAGLDAGKLTMIGESRLDELKVRPDYAVSYGGALVGFVELKAPGRGANPRAYRGHDRDQWAKLSALPNLVYSDGNSFSLWRAGERVGDIVRLDGDVESSGRALRGDDALLSLVASFLSWEPVAPSHPRQLAELSAGMCRLLRSEVVEQLELEDPALTHLAEDWRQLLFPGATHETFADGFAQTVTFGLLLARARGIDLHDDIYAVSRQLAKEHALIATALNVFAVSIQDDESRGLVTSMKTLTRVLSVVDWEKVSKGDSEAWLFFYEEFLAEYDPKLRRETGSYYTPVPVVREMVRLSDDALRDRFGLNRGLADRSVTVLDPAVGTGTYLLEVLRRIAATIADLDGPAAVSDALGSDDVLSRLIGFELQLGPFAVAQLRLLAELADLTGRDTVTGQLLLHVTSTLDNPYDDEHHLGWQYEAIAKSRRDANRVKRDVPVQVCIGNPPYKEKSKGAGGWVESGLPGVKQPAILSDFFPPSDWGVASHVKHLYNPYVYFWRWATWKVFDHHPDANDGIVCFISVAGFLAGPGFQRMRDYLRRRGDAIWVIECTPEGHQPPVPTRVFQGVQHPICITLVVRDGSTDEATPAPVFHRRLGRGPREKKFEELASITLELDGWEVCPPEWRAPFLPTGRGEWTAYPSLDDLLPYSGSGMMPGRTWPIAPDPQTLRVRWEQLVAAPLTGKAELFREHKTDRRIHTILGDNLPGYPKKGSIAEETGTCPEPVRVGYRSFDRQWIIPDKRLINRPNPTLWSIHSDRQVYLTALHRTAPSSGPGATLTGFVPDIDHYHGRGGRVYPLWMDSNANAANLTPALAEALVSRLGREVRAEDIYAYIAATVASPAYVDRFKEDLATPGLRVPLTGDSNLFVQGAQLGRRIIWLHTFGERFVDPEAKPPRPREAPRAATPPRLVKAIGDEFPDELRYDAEKETLRVGAGAISPVPTGVRAYETAGVNVLDKWFGYRRATRTKASIGERSVSPLDDVHTDHWLPSYTTELVEILNVLTLLVELEPEQAALLDSIVDGPLISVEDLTADEVLPVPEAARKGKPVRETQQSLDL